MLGIKSTELLNRIDKGDFTSLTLKGLQNGSFLMLLETNDGCFIHEHLNGEGKEYPKVDHALLWLKRKTKVKEIVVDVEIWNTDKC